MNTLYKVKDHPHLVKDMTSKAVLNTNYAALQEYKKQQQMKVDIDNLKSELGDIKILLTQLNNKLDK